MEEWELARLEARLWWCGDEECNCYQPQVTKITPNREAGYPWIHREDVWQGTFISSPDMKEMNGLLKELKYAAKRYSIRLRGEYGITRIVV